METVTFKTALGLFGVGWTERGLARVLLPDTSQKAMLERLGRDGARPGEPTRMVTGLMNRAVKVRASVLTSDPWQERDLVMPDVNSCTRKAVAVAYEMAGLGAEDIDLVELHDCFATAEILHYENLGLCGEGEAGRMIDEGEVALGGRIPVNVSGGLLSKGHPLGATGIANIYEVTTHLRGEAGARQVENARIGMTHVIGLGSACGIHILEKVS